MTPGLQSDARDPRRESPVPAKPEPGSSARESVVWESDAVRDAVTGARSDGVSGSATDLPKRCPHCEGEYEAALTFCPRDGAVLRAPVIGDDLTGQIIADRYRVLRKLGQGGMGQVYLAEHTRMGRICAMKVMSPALLADAGAIARFDREATNASRITHPGVAAIYDFGEASDGIVYLAMEYVDGEALTAVLRREQMLPIDRALRIARQIAGALSAAHELGIVHRDLKPDNIMVGRNRDGSDCVKVVDFGISKGVHGVSQKLTITGLVIGTPDYMSPEQLIGDPVDGRSDIYSLGIVLYQMVAGALPFTAGQDGRFARLIAAPRSLADSKPEHQWPLSLQSLLDRALAPAAGDRYPTADALAHDIERLLHESRSAMPPPAGAKPVQRLPRARTIVVGGAIIAAGSAAAMFGLSTLNDGRAESGVSSPPTRANSPAAPGGAEGTAAISTPGANSTRTGDSAVGPAAPVSGRSLGPDVPRPGPTVDGSPSRAGDSSGGVRTPLPPATQLRAVLGPAADLDSLEAWTSPTTGTDESARRALARFPSLLSRLSTGNDSVAAHYYAAGAYIELGDPASACAMLQRIERRATVHPYLAKAVASYLVNPTLNCRDREPPRLP